MAWHCICNVQSQSIFDMWPVCMRDTADGPRTQRSDADGCDMHRRPEQLQRHCRSLTLISMRSHVQTNVREIFCFSILTRWFFSFPAQRMHWLPIGIVLLQIIRTAAAQISHFRVYISFEMCAMCVSNTPDRVAPIYSYPFNAHTHGKHHALAYSVFFASYSKISKLLKKKNIQQSRQKKNGCFGKISRSAPV